MPIAAVIEAVFWSMLLKKPAEARGGETIRETTPPSASPSNSTFLTTPAKPDFAGGSVGDFEDKIVGGGAAVLTK